MSQPTRYDAADLRCKKCQKNVEVLGVLRSHDEGRFVMWDDYAALKAETVKRLEAAIPPVETYIGKLEAENERLRKAGDALLECHKVREDLEYSIKVQSPDVAEAMLAWLAAKEVQS